MKSIVRLDAASIELRAVLEAGSLSQPPLVALSFPGLAEPKHLFEDLERLGWGIPLRPPRPASAIDWTTSDESETDFTVRPYRIEEFRLQPGAWPADSRSRIGALTVAVLQKHGVQVHADSAYLELLYPAQVDSTSLSTIDLRSPVDPVPHTVIIERTSDSMARLCDYRSFGAVTRSTASELTWSERARPVAPNELRAQRKVVGNALFAWKASSGEAPEAETSNEKSLRIIVPDARQGAELIIRLSVLLGDGVGSLALSPMNGAINTKREALLIIGVVPADRIARVRDLLADRNPMVIIRR